MRSNTRSLLRRTHVKKLSQSFANNMPKTDDNKRELYLTRQQKLHNIRPRKLPNISVEYNNIKAELNNPMSIFTKSKAQESHYKQVEYTKLLKTWCKDNDDT